MKMKIVLPVMIFLCAVSFAQAQITLTAANAPVVGELITYGTDAMPTGVTIGSAGANQTWDFSSLQLSETTSVEFVSPLEAPNGSMFPTATFAQVTEGTYGFANVSASGVTVLGTSADFFGNDEFITAVFDPAQTVYSFPLTYETTYSGNYGFALTLDGSEFGVDSVRIELNASYNTEVDGHGTLITPAGTYNALRQYVETIEETKLYFLFFGTWIETESNQDTFLTYQWLTAEARGQALTLDVSETGDIFSATWFQSATTQILAPVADFDYEIQGGGDVQFTDASTNSPSSWTWNFGDGTNSSLQDPLHSYTASGTYEVCLQATNSAGSTSFCQDVTVVVVGTDEADDEVALRVFPNPAKDAITFEVKDANIGDLQLHVLNLLGQQVFNSTLNDSRTLDVSQFASGQYVYMLRAQDGRVVADGRFSKQ